MEIIIVLHLNTGQILNVVIAGLLTHFILKAIEEGNQK